jgi:hypothetical protein
MSRAFSRLLAACAGLIALASIASAEYTQTDSPGFTPHAVRRILMAAAVAVAVAVAALATTFASMLLITFLLLKNSHL